MQHMRYSQMNNATINVVYVSFAKIAIIRVNKTFPLRVWDEERIICYVTQVGLILPSSSLFILLSIPNGGDTGYHSNTIIR